MKKVKVYNVVKEVIWKEENVLKSTHNALILIKKLKDVYLVMKDFLFWMAHVNYLRLNNNIKYKTVMLMIINQAVLNVMIDFIY